MLMGKRSDYDRKPRDYYPTPYEATLPLLAHLPANSTFIEPCAGNGRLIRHLEKHGHKCVYACDIEPQAEDIEQRDALFFNQDFPEADFIITNPPWDRNKDGTGILHDMITVFEQHQTTWLLFDADWMHTMQAKSYLPNCSRIVSVGRVSWEGNGVSGMDNCCWYRFENQESKTEFIGRN